MSMIFELDLVLEWITYIGILVYFFIGRPTIKGIILFYILTVSQVEQQQGGWEKFNLYLHSV